MAKRKKIIFCDMDGTICESKQKISPELRKKLNTLGPIHVISGATREQMQHQLDGLICRIMAQSGNDTELWQNKLTRTQIKEIHAHIKKLGYPITPRHLQNRGCQVSYSFVGHNAALGLKKNFDPDRKLRKWFLKQFPFKSETLAVKIGGTTCLDYTKKNCTKGDNIYRWLVYNKIYPGDCIYFGDALFKGGNDESVIGVIKTIPVKDPADLLKKLNALR